MLLELKQSLNLKLQQQLVMTPQLQQAIRLLQLSRMELVDAIHAELEQNPALEEELRPEQSAIDQEAKITGEDPSKKEHVAAEKTKEVGGDETNANDIDWQQWLEQYNSAPPAGPSIRRDAEDLPTLEQTVSTEPTLYDHLVWQLNLAQLVDSDRAIATQIIGALDDDGFLTGERPCEDIAIRLEVSVDHVERVLKMVQTFDPVGVAARDLIECLTIQLDVMGNENKLAEKMIREYMSELEKRNFQAIAKKEEVPLEEVGNRPSHHPEARPTPRPQLRWPTGHLHHARHLRAQGRRRVRHRAERGRAPDAARVEVLPRCARESRDERRGEELRPGQVPLGDSG